MSLALTSLVFGTLGVLLGFCFYGFVFGLVGLGLGGMFLVRWRKWGGSGATFALIGVLLSAVALFEWLCFLPLWKSTLMPDKAEPGLTAPSGPGALDWMMTDHFRTQTWSSAKDPVEYRKISKQLADTISMLDRTIWDDRVAFIQGRQASLVEETPTMSPFRVFSPFSISSMSTMLKESAPVPHPPWAPPLIQSIAAYEEADLDFKAWRHLHDPARAQKVLAELAVARKLLRDAYALGL